MESMSGDPVWSVSDGLSDRVRRLRDEYFAFETRALRNEIMPFTTGTPWDTVYSVTHWTNVPELHPFLRAFEDSLLAAAKPVPLPKDFWDHPLPKRVALFFSEILRSHLPVDILDGELIVGGQFNVALSLCLDKRQAARRARRASQFLRGVIAASGLGIGNCGAVPGHLIPDYGRILRNGFRGVVQEIQKALAGEKEWARRASLEAFEIACRAVQPFAERYAQKAEEKSHGVGTERAEELMEIARICRRVPWEPAEGFHEALQSLWFTHMLVMVSESYPGPGVSFGRFDQILWPFLAKDLAAGRVSLEQARELLRCFWIKPNYAYDYQARLGRNQGINSSFGQLITLGGCGPNGEDLSNTLTHLCLDVMEEMNLLEPKPNVRLHKGTPDKLMKRVCGMMARSQGAPFLLNFDEASMKGLTWQGLPEDEVWDYAPVGCLENTRQGDDRSGTVDVNLNLAKPVELALFQGKDQRTGQTAGMKTVNPRLMTTWGQFEEAYKAQLSHCLRHLISLNNEADTIRALFEPTPYLSSIVGGCIEKGMDVTEGGAKYNFITVEGVALATASDSLTAVKHLVFDEKRLTMDALMDALEDNFEGHEFLRQLVLNKAPKYGNDEPEADEMARCVTTWWAQETSTLETPYTQKRYRAGYLSWNYGVAYAPLTWATPDGRKCGTFLSNGVAAVSGMDMQGPTAAARSVHHLDLEQVPNGDSHTLSLSPSIIRNEEGIAKFAGFLRGYGREGGTALQVNMIDSDTLRKAQEQPEAYRNLLVRVTGYNAYFVDIGKELQNEIIARIAHE